MFQKILTNWHITRGSGEEIANEQAKDRRSDVRVL